MLLLIMSGCKKELKYIEERDDCKIISGNFMHTVDDADDCKIKCLAACYSYKAELLDINFSYTKQCNICGCYCEIQ